MVWRVDPRTLVSLRGLEEPHGGEGQEGAGAGDLPDRRQVEKGGADRTTAEREEEKRCCSVSLSLFLFLFRQSISCSSSNGVVGVTCGVSDKGSRG